MIVALACMVAGVTLVLAGGKESKVKRTRQIFRVPCYGGPQDGRVVEVIQPRAFYSFPVVVDSSRRATCFRSAVYRLRIVSGRYRYEYLGTWR
jgi:hypothetical protein